jgi:diguanylate cyclase (GGDEF)-like protein
MASFWRMLFEGRGSKLRRAAPPASSVRRPGVPAGHGGLAGPLETTPGAALPAAEPLEQAAPPRPEGGSHGERATADSAQLGAQSDAAAVTAVRVPPEVRAPAAADAGRAAEAGVACRTGPAAEAGVASHDGRAAEAGGAAETGVAAELAALRDQVQRLERQLAGERELRRWLEERGVCATDPVTGLAAGVRFQDRLSVAIAQARRQKSKLAVVQVSLDGIEPLLERLGRQQGADLLRSVAVSLVEALREVDTVARLGSGDLFTVLLPGIEHDEDVTVIAEKLRLALRGPFSAGGTSRLLTASLGIAVFPEDGTEAETLLDNATSAARRARDKGGDAWDLHAPSSRASLARRVVRETALRQALARDEMALYWRPILACGTRAAVGLEAVLRWRGVGRSAHPADFVTPRDVPNLAVPLGQWLMRRACREAARWRRELRLAPVAIHVGLSGRQLAHAAFVDLVGRALEESALEPGALWLSIGLRDLHTASVQALKRLSLLRQRGIKTTLQGYGSSGSRLGDPYDYPLDALELDAAVVSDAPADPEREGLVAAVLSVAHARGLLVLADGADTKAHAALLARLGCDHMQGRACGLPMPAVDVEPWLCAGLDAVPATLEAGPNGAFANARSGRSSGSGPGGARQ